MRVDGRIQRKPMGWSVPQWMGTAMRGLMTAMARAAPMGSRCSLGLAVGPQPHTGSSARSRPDVEVGHALEEGGVTGEVVVLCEPWTMKPRHSSVPPTGGPKPWCSAWTASMRTSPTRWSSPTSTSVMSLEAAPPELAGHAYPGHDGDVEAEQLERAVVEVVPVRVRDEHDIDVGPERRGTARPSCASAGRHGRAGAGR